MEDKNDFLDLESDNSVSILSAKQKCEVPDDLAEKKRNLKRKFKEIQTSFDNE